jgi:hypothetical protein
MGLERVMLAFLMIKTEEFICFFLRYGRLMMM